MPPKKSLVKQTVALLRRRGQKSLKIARQSIQQEQIRHKPLADALRYFAESSFPDVMHPGLLSVYCEAVGGNPDETIQVGAAMTLLVAAADIHDDLVDESTVKNGKPTG
jgi:geranylgeranyl pyrophosphate synthase